MSAGYRSWFLRFLVLAVSWMLASCGKDEPPIVHVNQPPTVELTSGPIGGGTFSYAIEIAWIGNDPDGMIARYEYVVDPPTGFTEEEIASGGPGITSEMLKDLDGVTEVTRVTKEVNGETVSFDWIHTLDTSRNFRFSTSEAESTFTGGQPEPTGRFTGMHAVYVRAVDDDGAVSVPDKAAFTAETVAPESRFTDPAPWTGTLYLPDGLPIHWTGMDPDASPGTQPLHFIYKLLEVNAGAFLSDELETTRIFFQDPSEWIDLGDATESVFPVVQGRLYVLAIRAVDEAGATEPFVEWGRNALKFGIYLQPPSYPELTIRGPELSNVSPSDYPSFTFVGDRLIEGFTFRGYTPHMPIEIPLDESFTFSWSAVGDIWGYSWGLNIPNPEVDGPGWTVWSQDTRTREAITLRTSGIHTFHVRVRGKDGLTTRGTVQIRTFRYRFDREVLWIDDYKDSVFPLDAEHDDFWHRRFQDYPGALDWHEFQAESAQDPIVPSLDELGRYKILVWENTVGFGGQSALLSASTLSPVLRQYLRAGGKLWVGGRVNVSAMLPSANGLGADLNYPKQDIGPGDFAYDFVKLRSTRINRENGSTVKNQLIGVAPFPGEPVVYEPMSVDVTKLRQPFQNALTHIDAVFGPILGEDDPGFVGDIDTLYAYRSYGDEVLGQPSSYDNKLVALRWHDPDPDPLHGRIQWFGFPMYYMFEDQAQDTFNRSLDWFREGP